MGNEFEKAADGIVNGDLVALRELIRRNPVLLKARSQREHHATLLHYIAANGVEQERQITPPNAPQIARFLLTEGCDVDATADMYSAPQTTMKMLVSSAHPAAAGVQDELVEVLVDFGAAKDEALITALAHGYQSAAQTLARRGARTDSLPAAAGLGYLHEAEKFLPLAPPDQRHIALSLSAQHGHTGIVQLLLDAGEDPNRYNKPGFHGHSTPLHQAVCYGHEEVVRLLVNRGARLDMKDTVYQGTPLGWAKHCGRPTLENYLRAQ